MLCENCKSNTAIIHSVMIINGKKHERYLCNDCARGEQFSMPSLINILSGLQVVRRVEGEELKCACGNTFSNFQNTGLLGCAQCYTTFKTELKPVIKRAQGGKALHTGRRPKRYISAAAATQDDIGLPSEAESIKAELETAVKEERYERAAELRDRLRALERGEE